MRLVIEFKHHGNNVSWAKEEYFLALLITEEGSMAAASRHPATELHWSICTFVPIKGSNPIPCFCVPQHRGLVMTPTNQKRAVLVEKTKAVMSIPHRSE